MKKIKAPLIVITTLLFLCSSMTVVHAQITHIQFDPTNKDSFSYQEQHLTTGNLSLPNFNIDNTSTVELKAPGFSYMSVIPNGPALLQLGQHAGDITKILKEKGTRDLIHNVIKLFPKKNQKLLEQIDKTGYELLTTLTSPTSLHLPSPAPSSSPHISPPIAHSPTPVPTSSPSPTPMPSSPTPIPTQSLPPPIVPSPAPVSYPSRIEVVDLLACPETGQPQWIKLFNPDHREYILHKWHFYNSHNHKRVLNTALDAEGTVTVYFRSHLFLKAGDTISLVRPDNAISFTIRTPACIKKTTQDSPFPLPSLPPSQPSLPANQPPVQSQQPLPQNIYTPPILQATSPSAPQTYDFTNTTLPTSPVQSPIADDSVIDPQINTEGIGSAVLSSETPATSSPSAHVSGSDMIVRPTPEPTQNKKPFPFVGIVLIGISLVLLLSGGTAAAYMFYKKQKGKNTL